MNKKHYLLYALFAVCFLLFAFDSFGPRTDGGRAAVSSFVNFETPHVHPIDLTPNGQKLLSVNTADNRLEVWQLNGSGLIHLGSIPVGMDPVTVRVRNNNEAWVVNHLSDNISIVDLNQNIVTRILRTDNEPCDVVFGGSPQKAFISCSEANTVNVFQLNNLNAAPQKIRIIGEEPRAMAVSPDGNTVYTAFFESGNQTTIVPGGKGEGFQGGRAEDAVRHPDGPYGGVDVPPNDGNNFSPPMNPDLPPPPPTSLIVKKQSDGRWLDDNDGDWTPFISGNLAGESHRVPGWDLPDRDVAVMNANSLNVSYQRSLMNIQMAMGINPVYGRATVVGTNGTNEIRFEPNVKGNFLRVQFASFTPGANNTITDLNPHLNYNLRNIPQSQRNQSLADPRGVAWNSSGTRCYVTGMGSNNVVVLSSNGQRAQQQPIEVGEGPTGIVLHESSNRGFVLNKFDGSISIIDLNSNNETARVDFYDPTPQVIKDGRPHLYDAHNNSGLGHISCASCHVDARTDGLAWDLGDPQGEITFPAPGTPTQGAPFNGFHPMKGPMRTSVLQDIINHPSMHWRGDRQDIFEFAEAYESLQGADNAKPTNEMQQLENFLNTIHFPPNPYRNLDNSIANAVPIFGPNNTILRFANPLNAIEPYQNSCLSCHPGQRGRSDRLVENFLHVGTHQIPETFRGFYERSGFFSFATDGNTSGFGKLPDGSEFFDISQMNIPAQRNDEFAALLMSFDGGVPWADPQDMPSQDAHAAVGQQVTVNGSISSSDQNLLNQLIGMANAQAVGLIAKGRFEDEFRGFSYQGNNSWRSDRAGQTVSQNDLMGEALNGNPITFTVVPRNT
ncbi:MAG: beta-propeller fold lactonase family protein, partial [Bacteroidota bacterium]